MTQLVTRWATLVPQSDPRTWTRCPESDCHARLTGWWSTASRILAEYYGDRLTAYRCPDCGTRWPWTERPC